MAAAVVKALALALLGAGLVKLLASRSGGAGGVKPAILVFVPASLKKQSQVFGETREIGKGLGPGTPSASGRESWTLPLIEVGEPGSYDVSVDVIASVYVPPANAYYGNGGKQMCLARRYTARLTVSQLASELSNVQSTDANDLCLNAASPDQRQNVWPWYSGAGEQTAPELQLVAAAGRVSLRIDARFLASSDERVAGSGQGHTAQWYQQHVGPFRYPLRIVGNVTIEQRAA